MHRVHSTLSGAEQQTDELSAPPCDPSSAPWAVLPSSQWRPRVPVTPASQTARQRRARTVYNRKHRRRRHRCCWQARPTQCVTPAAVTWPIVWRHLVNNSELEISTVLVLESWSWTSQYWCWFWSFGYKSNVSKALLCVDCWIIEWVTSYISFSRSSFSWLHITLLCEYRFFNQSVMELCFWFWTNESWSSCCQQNKCGNNTHLGLSAWEGIL